MRTAIRDILILTALAMVWPIATRTAAQHADLSGTWEMNRDSSSPPGGGLSGAGGRGMGRGGGGGGGGRGGFGGAGGRGGGRGERPSQEQMEQQRALMQEVAELPTRLTITQRGDLITFAGPDGTARSYAANGKIEKHQLTNGTIETKTAWDGQSLRMAITLGDRGKLIRTFSRREPRRLEVSTAFDGAPKDGRHIVVYDAAEE